MPASRVAGGVYVIGPDDAANLYYCPDGVKLVQIGKPSKYLHNITMTCNYQGTYYASYFRFISSSETPYSTWQDLFSYNTSATYDGEICFDGDSYIDGMITISDIHISMTAYTSAGGGVYRAVYAYDRLEELTTVGLEITIDDIVTPI